MKRRILFAQRKVRESNKPDSVSRIARRAIIPLGPLSPETSGGFIAKGSHGERDCAFSLFLALLQIGFVASSISAGKANSFKLAFSS
jgi:hypothetical protein